MTASTEMSREAFGRNFSRIRAVSPSANFRNHVENLLVRETPVPADAWTND